MRYYNYEPRKMDYECWNVVASRLDEGKRAVQEILLDYWNQLIEGNLYPNSAPASRKLCGVKLQLTHEMREYTVNLYFLT